MRCLTCGVDNPLEARFCYICGAPIPVPLAAGDLVPRELGALIDYTFEVYRSRFGAFFAIALIAQAIPLARTLLPASNIASWLLYVASAVVGVMALGATILAVADWHLGREIGVGWCYRRALGRARPLLGSALVVAIALALSAFLVWLIVGLFLFPYLFVIWFFCFHAVMLEGSDILPALGRSRELVRGNWLRVFGIGAAYLIMLVCIAILTLIPVSVVAALSPIAASALAALAGGAITPILYIGSTLVYMDLRIRREGYTLEVMASEMEVRPSPY